MLSLSQNVRPIQIWENYVKHEPKNKMVAGQNSRRLMRLRAEVNREMPLSELLGQAEPQDAGAKEAGSTKASFSKYLRPIMSKGENSPSPESVTKYKDSLNQPFKSVKPTGGPIPPRLQERILGKSPLRLVTARVARFLDSSPKPTYWLETLACGHIAEAFPQFFWDQGGHLIQSVPTAKRRRCQECKAMELTAKFPPKKPSVSVRAIPDRKANEK